MTSTLDPKKRLALAIIDFLQKSTKDGTLQPEDNESIEIATSCIADTFHVDPNNKVHMESAIGSQNLLSIYSVYDKLRAQQQTSKEGAGKSGEESSKGAQAATGTVTDESETLKKQGNGAMAKKEYSSAIDFYTRAITIVPTNPIYLSNRAAAYSAAHKHTEAAADAELAVATDPKYTKAWSRLGLARFVLGDARGSMEAYQRGIDAEGTGGSEAMKKGYETARKKVEEQEREGDANTADLADDVDDSAGSSRGAPGGMPDLSALAGMMGGGGGGGGGGMPDMASMMNNPMFAKMAQNVMSNPDALQGLLNNPGIKQMAEKFGLGGAGAGAGAGAGRGPGAAAGAGSAGGGGMPDLASMMQDPAIAEMAKSFMGGGAGGGAGAGRGAGRGGS